MIAGIVLTTLACIGTGAQFIHSQRQCLVRLNTQSAERHGTRHEVSDDALHGFYLIETHPLPLSAREGSRCLLKGEEIAEEDGTFLFINSLCPLFKLLVVSLSASQLQFGDGLWVPSVLDAVLTPRELTMISKGTAPIPHREGVWEGL